MATWRVLWYTGRRAKKGHRCQSVMAKSWDVLQHVERVGYQCEGADRITDYQFLVTQREPNLLEICQYTKKKNAVSITRRVMIRAEREKPILGRVLV
jgi:hypothetical protein